MKYLESFGINTEDIYSKNKVNYLSVNKTCELIGISKDSFIQRFRHGSSKKYDQIKYPEDFPIHPKTNENLISERHLLRVILESRSLEAVKIQNHLINLIMSGQHSKIKPKMSGRIKKAITNFLQYLIKLIN